MKELNTKVGNGIEENRVRLGRISGLSRGLINAAGRSRSSTGSNFRWVVPSALVLRFIITVAFGRRCIPAGGVAPPSNIPDILGRRALPAGRLAALDASP